MTCLAMSPISVARISTRPQLATLANLDLSTLPLVEGTPRIGPCVAGTGKFICIGLNYADHAAESGMAVPPGTRDLHEGDLGDRRPER